MHDGPDVRLGQVDGEIGLLGRLVRVVDAGEALDLAAASAGVDAALVSGLAVLERGVDVDKVEGAVLLAELAGRLAALLEGSDGRSNDGSAGASQLRGDESDAADVDVAVLAGEAKLRRQLVTDSVTEQQRDAAATLLVESDVQGTRNGVLARVLVASKEDGETLLVAGRVRLAEDLDDLGVREPLGDVSTGAEALTEF